MKVGNGDSLNQLRCPSKSSKQKQEAKLAKKRKRNQKWIGGYQRGFEYSDLAWLAKRFQKQAERNSDLTLEEFAISYGIQPEFLRRFIVLSKSTVTLWHGTTVDRARKIMREGFRRQRKIWFTQNQDTAWGVAKNRAKGRGKAPVVFCCEINLYKYSKFEKTKPEIYAFSHKYIARDVIQSVSHLEEDEPEGIRRVSNLKEGKENKDELVDVVITQNSGKLGVLYWINRYLELKGEAAVNEEHSAVEAIFEWVEAQYADGRDEPISDEEMMTQMIIHLGQEAQIGQT
jgi:hypothetical protein